MIRRFISVWPSIHSAPFACSEQVCYVLGSRRSVCSEWFEGLQLSLLTV